jgi:Sec-independent protein translocase protein TatA
MIIVVAGLFVIAMEKLPIVVTNSGEQVNQAESVKKLMTQLSNSVRNRTNRQDIDISQDQLNSFRLNQYFG